MLLKDISFPTPQQNILFDEVLLQSAETGQSGEVLRFWEAVHPCIVLGRISKPEEDVYVDKALADGIQIVRRTSGGGTVVQAKGCLNFCLILSKERNPLLQDIGKSYRFILDQVIDAMKELGIAAVFQGTSDLALEENNRKFSGNAQHRGRRFILHHGTMLYDFDLTLLERYLKIPRDVPAYRRGRPHGEFVANIGVPPEKIKQAFQEKFSVEKAFASR